MTQCMNNTQHTCIHVQYQGMGNTEHSLEYTQYPHSTHKIPHHQKSTVHVLHDTCM